MKNVINACMLAVVLRVLGGIKLNPVTSTIGNAAIVFVLGLADMDWMNLSAKERVLAILNEDADDWVAARNSENERAINVSHGRVVINDEYRMHDEAGISMTQVDKENQLVLDISLLHKYEQYVMEACYEKIETIKHVKLNGKSVKRVDVEMVRRFPNLNGKMKVKERYAMLKSLNKDLTFKKDFSQLLTHAEKWKAVTDYLKYVNEYVPVHPVKHIDLARATKAQLLKDRERWSNGDTIMWLICIVKRELTLDEIQRYFGKDAAAAELHIRVLRDYRKNVNGRSYGMDMENIMDIDDAPKSELDELENKFFPVEDEGIEYNKIHWNDGCEEYWDRVLIHLNRVIDEKCYLVEKVRSYTDGEDVHVVSYETIDMDRVNYMTKLYKDINMKYWGKRFGKKLIVGSNISYRQYWEVRYTISSFLFSIAKRDGNSLYWGEQANKDLANLSKARGKKNRPGENVPDSYFKIVSYEGMIEKDMNEEEELDYFGEAMSETEEGRMAGHSLALSEDALITRYDQWCSS